MRQGTPPPIRYRPRTLKSEGRLERLIRQSPRVPGNPMLMSMAGATLTRYALREFVARSRGSERGLRLDPTIAARWGIQIGPEAAPAGRI